MSIDSFSISIDDKTLNDLRVRLENTRWAQDFSNDDWQYGTNGKYLKELVDYWLNTYDWRKQESAMNQWPQFKTVIDDVPIHFIHARGKGPNPTPIILTHGWPCTFWDYKKLIEPLTNPAAFGGDPANSFDVVIPSLPGFGFSTPLTKPGVNFWETGDLWVKLMEALGYKRFAAHGGDWGSFITTYLGHRHADRLIGAHVNLTMPLDIHAGGVVPDEDYGPEDLEQKAKNEAFGLNESGYMALQLTKPQTPAFGLNDSPVGLCAWILEKRRTWSDCDGNVESCYTKDDLLTNVMIYWVTQCYGTSARFYYEAAHNLWQASHQTMPMVQAPTGVAVFAKELVIHPRRWAERYYNVKRWTEFSTGGHFPAMEKPAELVADIHAFFAELS